MRLFEYTYRLKDYLSADGRVPKDTGNLQDRGFHVMQTAPNTISLVIGDQRQVPYAALLETGFTRDYHHAGRVTIDKHKGWASRGTKEFAEMIAKQLGGVVSYD